MNPDTYHNILWSIAAREQGPDRFLNANPGGKDAKTD